MRNMDQTTQKQSGLLAKKNNELTQVSTTQLQQPAQKKQLVVDPFRLYYEEVMIELQRI